MFPTYLSRFPDNRLVFTVGQKIGMEVERNSFTYKTVIDMSDVRGYPSRLNVSPDGTQILFEMVTKTSLWLSTVHYRDATVWAVNVDGTNLRQVATSSREDDPDNDYDDPQVNMPVWSPDGQSLLLTEDYTSGGAVWADVNGNVNVIPIIDDALTYVLPADSVDQKIPPAHYSTDDVRPLLSLGTGGSLGAVTVDPLSPVMWAPSYPRPEVITGSLPTFGGRPNRGVSGSMTFLTENDDGSTSLVSVELATSTPRTLTTIMDRDLNRPAYAGIAADNSRSAHYVYDYDDDFLRIIDIAGELVKSVALITNRYDYTPESAFQFSPIDNNLIAWIYDDGDFGTGVVVLNVATMTFVGKWEDLDYDTIAWTADGDLLLFDDSDISNPLHVASLPHVRTGRIGLRPNRSDGKDDLELRLLRATLLRATCLLYDKNSSNSNRMRYMFIAWFSMKYITYSKTSNVFLEILTCMHVNLTVQ